MKNKEFKIKLTKIQREALLVLLGEAEQKLDLKEALPEHDLRSAAYKAIRKIRQATPTVLKD